MPSDNDRPISAMRILVADDSPDGANSLADLLRLEFGCTTFAVYDGAQALHMAFAERPDVVILDIRMPAFSGIEVAARVRSADTAPAALVRPLLLAVTGAAGVTHELSAIDANFDGAFAKPIDLERLIADLSRHWHGQPQRAAATRVDLFECFTRAARNALPLMVARGQTVAFDCDDASIVVEGDELAFRSAMYRLMAGIADAMGQGFVVLMAQARVDDSGAAGEADEASGEGGAILTVSVAGTGEAAPPARVDKVLARLGLVSNEGSEQPPSAPGARSASGPCPVSGGTVVFSSAPGEGMLFRLELRFKPVEQLEPMSDARGTLAWVVDAGGVRAAVLERRLQRFGWRVRRIATVSEAAAVAGVQPADPSPALVVVHEGDGTSGSAMLDLRRRLPAESRLKLLVVAGSTVLAEPIQGPDIVRVEPLGPADIGRLTEQAVAAAGEAGLPSAWGTIEYQRSRVLIVDDNEVNRMIATGLVQALGCDVACASDGLDAIEQCKASPPDVVLMDVNMPVLNGIDATQRLRELQRSGRVAPFAIVAATTSADDETEMRCLEAGMDGFLTKPLHVIQVQNELARVTRLGQ